MTKSSKLAKSFNDFYISLKQWRVWVFWAQHELHQRYRRSFLGPLWISFTMAFYAVVMGIVWAILFHMPYQQYLPYVTLGLILWSMVSGIMSEGATCFINFQSLITQTTRPLPTYFFQLVYKHFLNFCHNLIVYVIIALIFKVKPDSQIFLLPIAFPIMILGVSWMGFMLAMISVRYRDIPNLISSMMMVLVFVTPIMFQKKDLAAAPYIVQLNPLYHLIEIVRAPILGMPATAGDWIWAVSFLVVGWSIVALVYARYRSRIAYWL